ncbi:dephospho-CoA kinase [Sharpea azabuensis]|uniref:Dephospho-CoA kinase n=1 Tax=Sharpea azabuensis TaxID=322505 RepID=A0A1H6UFT8_9FIRM|nr:dephospho-CoA kinase [Sharpea azabuensis]SEI90496.1 dephospho-CoA kinase [Sharpea azabuensis]
MGSKTVIGITGGIASGKSTVTNYLITHGYDVVDADEIVHHAYEKESGCYKLIQEVFHSVNRHEIGQIVFHDASKRQLLESILHPYVYQVMEDHITKSSHQLVFLDVPLLFEAHFDKLCDKTICVYLDEDRQIERLMKRDHLSSDEAKNRIALQMPLAKKKAMATYTIDNSGYLEDLEGQILKILEDVNKDGTL